MMQAQDQHLPAVRFPEQSHADQGLIRSEGHVAQRVQHIGRIGAVEPLKP